MNGRSVSRATTHRHPMRVVTRRTGISPELLRVWERRYGVVTPARTHTGRRLYTDHEIERLHLLYQATRGGRSIGLIAALSAEDLRELLRQDAEAEHTRDIAKPSTPNDAAVGSPADRFLSESLDAVEQFDHAVLGAVLQRASVALPVTLFLETVVSTLLERVATGVRTGTLRPVDEYLTTAVVRRVLEQVMVEALPPAPKLLLATVSGYSHETGALIGAVAAASEGWSVTWLGAGVTADDIAEAATKLRARVVVLTITNPIGKMTIATELRRLRSALPRSVELIAGGAAGAGYDALLHEIGVTRVPDLSALLSRLREISDKRPAATRPLKTTGRARPRRLP